MLVRDVASVSSRSANRMHRPVAEAARARVSRASRSTQQECFRPVPGCVDFLERRLHNRAGTPIFVALVPSSTRAARASTISDIVAEVGQRIDSRIHSSQADSTLAANGGSFSRSKVSHREKESCVFGASVCLRVCECVLGNVKVCYGLAASRYFSFGSEDFQGFCRSRDETTTKSFGS